MAEVISAQLFAKAGPFITAGEKRTAQELKKLPTDWIVICNKMLGANNGRNYEVDFIVIADNAIFLLDEKSWSGKIITNDQEWVQKDSGWSDDFLVLPIVPPAGNPLAASPPPTSPTELINELYIAAEAFKVLAVIHQYNVLHRAINPGTIYIRQNSAPFGLMFTNFFAARVSKEGTITSSLDALAFENPYIAPELRESYKLAQPQSDVFSPALVFLERRSGQQLKTLRPNVAERVVLPDLQACWPSLPSEGIARLAELFDTIFYSPSITLRPLPTAVADRLKEIARTLE